MGTITGSLNGLSHLDEIRQFTSRQLISGFHGGLAGHHVQNFTQGFFLICDQQITFPRTLQEIPEKRCPRNTSLKEEHWHRMQSDGSWTRWRCFKTKTSHQRLKPVETFEVTGVRIDHFRHEEPL